MAGINPEKAAMSGDDEVNCRSLYQAFPEYSKQHQSIIDDGLNPTVVMSSSSTASPISTPNYPSLMPFPTASPCAACKLLRRRCAKECIFAPYFPSEDPQKFASVHRIFGASNVNKMLQELPQNMRADAVSSMVYEANARLHDPVYGCTKIIFHLHHQSTHLKSEITKLKARLFQLSVQQNSVISKINLGLSSPQNQDLYHNLASPNSPQPSSFPSAGATACSTTLKPLTIDTSTSSFSSNHFETPSSLHLYSTNQDNRDASWTSMYHH